MTQTQDNTYATTAANAGAGAPNKVTVVNDGAGDRQVVTLGAGDGTTTLVGTTANPLVAQPGDGTNNANVLKSDGTAAGQNAQLVAGAGYTTGTITLNSGTSATVWHDMLNYAWVSVEILTNTTPATLTFQTSGDASQTNITSAVLDVSNGSTGAGVSTTTGTTQTFHGPRQGRYFRVSSNNGAGTTTLVLTFFTYPSATMSRINSVQSANPTGSAVPANAFYMGANDGTNLYGLRNMAGAADAQSSNYLAVGLGIFNGSNIDRVRANTTGVVIAAGATATNAGVTTTTYNASKAVIILNVSAYTSGTITVTINGVTSSGYTYPILVSAAIGATGVTPLRIFPGATASANAVANDMVPRSLQVVTTGTFSLTYGIDFELSV